MNESNHDTGEQDRDLRDLIGSSDVRTSRTHDETVLAAAREVARSRRRVEVESRDVRTRPWRRAIPVSLAAGLAVLVFALYPRMQQHSEDDTLRSVEAGLEQFVTPAEAATLHAPPVEFRWPKQAGATSYRVVLRNASADVIWRSAAVPDPEVKIDDTVRSTLQPQTYYWTVEVEGTETARRLGPFWFRLQ
jgi:hypothetical protein